LVGARLIYSQNNLIFFLPVILPKDKIWCSPATFDAANDPVKNMSKNDYGFDQASEPILLKVLVTSIFPFLQAGQTVISFPVIKRSCSCQVSPANLDINLGLPMAFLHRASVVLRFLVANNP
jgi:hypothetical protein